MPKIITVAHQKGGVGKSTIAFNLAFSFAQSLKVAVLDTDVQASITQLLNEEKQVTIIPLPENLNELKSIETDLIIIDTPPYLSNRLPELFALSDFVLIPTKTGILDFMAIQSTIKMVKNALLKNPAMKWAVLFTMVNTSAKLAQEIGTALEEMQAPLLNTQITQRVSYVRSLITGGILKTDDLKAKYEIISLAEELLAQLQY